jgi:hypothetical protein
MGGVAVTDVAVTCETSSYSGIGYFQPVDTGRTLNTVKGGSVIPLKFRAYDGESLMTDASIISFKVAEVTCGSVDTVITDDIEYTVAGATTLRWDGTQFIHNWRIPPAKGKCYRVTHTIGDAAPGTAGATPTNVVTAVFTTR